MTEPRERTIVNLREGTRVVEPRERTSVKVRETTNVTMITIDGSIGEGGGQILRTSLALSLATGQPFRIDNIRAQRSKPGLLRQHLTAVNAAAAVGGAEIDGATLGSRSLTFRPRAVTPGDHHFAVGTAGSATLVLQTVLPPLLIARSESRITVEGGTHNRAAPPFDFLDRVFLPLVNRLGVQVTAELIRPGFYPAGGGAIALSIRPAAALSRLDLAERGEIVRRRLRALVVNLPRHIAEREIKTASRLLNWDEDRGEIDHRKGGPGPGNAIFVEVEAEHVTEIATGFGEAGVTAEAVADPPAREMRRYLAAGVPVGCHLADQLLTVLALGEGGVFTTLPLSQHARTNAEVIRRFLDVRIDVGEKVADTVRVELEGARLRARN